MQKIWDTKYTYRIIALGAIALLIIGVIPLLIVGQYAHPCADDYTYGIYPFSAWKENGSLVQVLYWAAHQAKIMYDTWQGTFASAFLMALTPIIWGEEYYFLTPIIMLVMTIVSHFCLFYVILVKKLNASKSIWCIISSIVTFVMIESMHSPVNAYFWYIGGMHYLFMHGCMILLFAAIIHTESSANRWKEVLLYVAACILCVACGGSNYSTALTGLLGLIFLVALKWFLGQRRAWKFIPLVVYIVAFYKNVTAYGITYRQANFTQSDPIKAVIDSFIQCFHWSGQWMSIPICLFMLFLIPFFWKAAQNSKFKFGVPALVSILSICAVACMFTPSLYAMGSAGPDRQINIVKIWFCLLLFLNEGYWIGYIHRKLEGKLPVAMPDVRLYVAGILCLILISFVVNVENRLFDYSSYAAYVSLKAGEAQTFDKEYKERLEVLNGPEEIAVLQPYSVTPWLLYFDDVETDIYDWKNVAVARWYGKDNVILDY